MPIPPDFAAEKFGNPQQGLVEVFVGPCSIALFPDEKIPMDGRKYKVDGTIHFKCGISLPARFTLDTTGFDFIVLPSAIVFHQGRWFHYDEEPLAQILDKVGELLPFTWTPDRELDYWCKAPYPMRFDPSYNEEQRSKIPRWWEEKK